MGTHFCSTHSEKMKVFAVLTSVLALASAQDWTCDECAEASVAVGDFLSADYNIASEVAILIEQLCPQHPDPEYCAANMPAFWGTIGPIVWKEHWLHVCDDLDCPSVKSSVPSCEACQARVNAVADALAWEETITGWVSGLSDWCTTAAEDVAECQAAIEWGIPLAFKALVEADRGWVSAFCQAWTACPAN